MALGSDSALGGLKKSLDNWFNPQNSYSMGSILTLVQPLQEARL